MADKQLGGEIVVYEAPDGMIQVDVRLEQETVWLSLTQIADLFSRDKSVISRHLRNVFTSGELERERVVAFFATTAADQKTYQVEYFNLDAILSVGYRVNSKRGTQFRIWATRTLRQHLLAGFTLNERRLAERGLGEMEQAVALLAQTLSAHALVTDEGQAVLQVIQRYTRSWRWLIEFDEDRLAQTPAQPVTPGTLLGLAEARMAIAALRSALLAREEASPLFGQERSDALAGILGAIEQTFDGMLLYPSAQEQAAHLLYFLVKDHPFVDGNKRIGALLFLEYLRRNGLLLGADGRSRLADSAMVALTLLIAESQPRHKELMVRLVLNLLEDQSQ